MHQHGKETTIRNSSDRYADPNLDWGPGNVDRRHVLVGSGTVELPGRLTLGAIWTVKSSTPFSALAATFNANGINSMCRERLDKATAT